VNDTRFVASSFLTIFFVLGFIAPRSSAFVSWFGDRVRSTIVSIRSTGEGARGASDAVYPPPLGRKARKGGEACPRDPASFRGSLLSNPFAPARAAGKDNHSTKLADVPKATRFLCGGGAIPASPRSMETPSFLEFSQRRRQHQDGSGWTAVVDVDGQAKTISSEYFH
jgi:hypothetical protein